MYNLHLIKYQNKPIYAFIQTPQSKSISNLNLHLFLSWLDKNLNTSFINTCRISSIELMVSFYSGS
jgi:hypothetical protein